MIKNPFLLLWLFFHLCLFSIQHEIQALEEESGILHNNNNNQMLWHIPMLDHGDDEIFQQQKRSLSDDCYIPSQQQSERAYIHALQLVEFLSRTVIPKYERKYRSNLEILLVARAGTNPRGSKVLKNFTNKGELSLSQIVTVIENELKKRPQLVSEDDYYIYNQSHNELLTQVIDLYEEKNPNQTLKFSHLGFAIRDLSEPSPYLQWKVIHMLKPCSKNNTEIFQGGLGWFFVDRPYLYATQIITLPPKIQQAVKKIITNPQWSGSLLAERYLLTASYQSREALNVQNSNTWPLEVLALALKSQEEKNFVINRKTAIDYLMKTGYQPTKVFLSHQGLQLQAQVATNPVLNRVLPSFLRVNSKDHPYLGRYYLIEGITALSVVNYLQLRLGNQIQIYEFESVVPDNKLTAQ